MICAHCRKKIRGKSELLYLVHEKSTHGYVEVGLHGKCDKAYNGG
jgi:hypothetical protein